MNMALVELRNVTKRYHKGGETITPLDDVSLDVEEGEFVSLMGASGTGKSTLLNLIASIDRPDSGTITVDGTDITKLSRTKLANWRAANIGYIFQTHNLIPVLTAYENVELPLLLLPMSRAERQKRVEIALEAVDLSDRADHYPRQLSGGQEQRVGVARAIVTHPTVVVADEPTGNLDDDTSEQILRLLARLNEELGVTLLMVTHDADAAAIAGRQLRLEHGKLFEKPRGVQSTGRESRCLTGAKVCNVQVPALHLEDALAASLADDSHGERLGGRAVRVLLRRLGAAGDERSRRAGRRRSSRSSCSRPTSSARPRAICRRTTKRRSSGSTASARSCRSRCSRTTAGRAST